MKRNQLHVLLMLLAVAMLAACTQPAGQEATKPAAKTKFSFAFFTDVHLNKTNRGNGNEGLRQALDRASQLNVDFILFGGDNVDVDALKEDEATADTLYQRFKAIVDEAGIPAYYTIGNHDRFYYTDGQPNKEGFNKFIKYLGPTYQTFDHKGVKFITLNSLYPTTDGNYSVSNTQLVWLKQILAEAGKEMPVVISIHVPMLSLYYPVVEGKLIAKDMIENTKEVFDIINPYNVQVVLQGHQHIYEQIQERNKWFVTAGAISAYWWGGPFMETNEGFLLVSVDAANNITWRYETYGWNAANQLPETNN